MSIDRVDFSASPSLLDLQSYGLNPNPFGDLNATATPTQFGQTSGARVPQDGNSSVSTPSQGTLVAGRPDFPQPAGTYPSDAFVDTTHHDWGNPVIGGWQYGRDAQLRRSRDGLSVAADVSVRHSSDGKLLTYESTLTYQDTTGKPISKVYIEERVTVKGSEETGKSWSVGGQFTSAPPGGGATIGGGTTWQNTRDGYSGGMVGNKPTISVTGSRSIGIDNKSGDFKYSATITVVYQDGTKNSVNVTGITESR
jgi:hypothetical protein